MKSDKEVLEIIRTAIENVFIREKYCSACLSATLLFWELARKYNIDVEPLYGTLSYGEMKSNIHFWNVFEGHVYDPTIKVMKSMMHNLDVNKFEYKNKILNRFDMEEVQMFALFISFQALKSADLYFSKAPKEVRSIRKKIHKIVGKSLSSK